MRIETVTSNIYQSWVTSSPAELPAIRTWLMPDLNTQCPSQPWNKHSCHNTQSLNYTSIDTLDIIRCEGSHSHVTMRMQLWETETIQHWGEKKRCGEVFLKLGTEKLKFLNWGCSFCFRCKGFKEWWNLHSYLYPFLFLQTVPDI